MAAGCSKRPAGESKANPKKRRFSEEQVNEAILQSNLSQGPPPLRKNSQPPDSPPFFESCRPPSSASGDLPPAVVCVDCVLAAIDDAEPSWDPFSKLGQALTNSKRTANHVMLSGGAEKLHWPTKEAVDTYFGPNHEVCVVSPLARARVINFMVHCQSTLPHPLSAATLHTAVSCLDRFISTIFKKATCEDVMPNCDLDVMEKKTPKHHLEGLAGRLPAVASACLHLASKMMDVWPLHVKDLVAAGNCRFSVNDILIYERQIAQALDFQISRPTTLDYVNSFMREAQEVLKIQTCTFCQTAVQSAQYGYALLTFDSKRWTPKYKEGRGRCAVESCVVFLTELFLAHPVSLAFSYDLIAASSMYAVVAILNSRNGNEALPDLLPSYCSTILRTHKEAAKCTTSILSTLDEFIEALAGLETTSESETIQRIASYLPNCGVSPLVWQKDATLQSAYEAIWVQDSEVRRRTMLAAYLTRAATTHNHQLSHWNAKKAAAEIIDNQVGFPHQTSIGLTVEMQQPDYTDESLPMGLFGYDVSVKHKDAVNHLRKAYLEWVKSHVGSSSENLSTGVSATMRSGAKRTTFPRIEGREAKRRSASLPLTCGYNTPMNKETATPSTEASPPMPLIDS